MPIFHLPAAEPEEMQAKALHAFHFLWQGYGSVRRFNSAWLKWLSLFLQWRDLMTYGFYEQLEIEDLPEELRRTFLAMRNRIESGRAIAELEDAT
ncbi:MAG: hypothetical protein ABIU29_06905 [Chthoniobacterales bacterium]